jgi:hypothetical protein
MESNFQNEIIKQRNKIFNSSRKLTPSIKEPNAKLNTIFYDNFMSPGETIIDMSNIGTQTEHNDTTTSPIYKKDSCKIFTLKGTVATLLLVMYSSGLILTYANL